MANPIVVPAEEWRRESWKSLPQITRSPLSEMWVHHSGLGTKTFQTLLGNERYHVKTLGWRALGYNFAVVTNRIDNGFARIFVGRDWLRVGGHTKGRNGISHAVLLVGGWEKATPKEIEAAARSVAWLMIEGEQLGATIKVVSGGHREAPNQATSCPGSAGIEVARRAKTLVAQGLIEVDDMAHLSEDAQKFYEEQYKRFQALKAPDGTPDPARPTTLPNLIERLRRFLR